MTGHGGRRADAGRKRILASQRLSRVIGIRVTKEEGLELERKAAAEKLKLADWIRLRLFGRK